MGEHSDYFGKLLCKVGSYRLHLGISVGEPCEIVFSAKLVKKGMNDRQGTALSGLGFSLTPRRGRVVDAYIMTSHGNGGCFLCFSDSNMNVAVQAKHSVKKLCTGGGSAVMIVDFWVPTYAEALKAVEKLHKTTLDV